MRILFFAQVKDATDRAEVELDLGDLDTDGLWQKLMALYPRLAPFRGNVRLARNLEYVGPGARFSDADEVALIPPVSGG
jgi:molybdopterin converting factor subunit 1